MSYGLNLCGTISGCKDYGTIDLTMPPQPFDRIISLELAEFEDAKPMIVDSARNCYLPVITGAQFAACNVGTICDGSYTDPVLVVCPGGDAVFQVYLRNALGDPVAGDSSVYIDLVNCSESRRARPEGGYPVFILPIAHGPTGCCVLCSGRRVYSSCIAVVNSPCGQIAAVPCDRSIQMVTSVFR